jgi:hypothetical protein
MTPLFIAAIARDRRNRRDRNSDHPMTPITRSPDLFIHRRQRLQNIGCARALLH